TGVKRMFARIERRHPYTLVTGIDQVTMLEFETADVFVRFANVRDDHANIANRNLDHGHLFDLNEPWIEVPCTGQEHLFLQTTAATAIQECLRILEVLVPR